MLICMVTHELFGQAYSEWNLPAPQSSWKTADPSQFFSILIL